jgi:hypothetical protein
MKTLLLLISFISANELFANVTTVQPGNVIRIKQVSERPIIVKLYPNPSYNGTITVSSNIEEAVTLYVFDLDGKLVHQVSISNKQKQMINGLKKGTYMYNVQNKDENIDGGKIIIK